MGRLPDGASPEVIVTGGLLVVQILAAAPVSGTSRESTSYMAQEVTPRERGALGTKDRAWDAAEGVSWGPEPYRTCFRALWDAQGLFVRFDAEDSSPWHTLERRDDPIWDEEVVELFLEPFTTPGEYAEVEISPANVVCDLWIDFSTGRFDRSWNLEGLLTKVEPLAKGSGSGFTAAAFLPWTGLASPPTGAAVPPPREWDRWRFNVFRIKRPGGPKDKERGALYLAWSETGQKTFHVPSAFRELVFAPPLPAGRGGKERSP